MPEDTEGVTKYRLDFQPAPALDWASLAELDAWRGLLFRLGLTGHDPSRYGGLAYGNVSQRLAGRGFLVSGTQTGGIEGLTAHHYCLVTGFDIPANRLVAEGPIRPSSEALTHAAVYRAAAANCVLHVHSPELWNHAQALAIPTTDPDIAYGTPAMATAVENLLREPGIQVIAMGGHRDGLIAVGETCAQAALPLIRLLAEATRLERVSGG
ncbi:class II aldolase/adducin family protein [Methylomagnum sp.]